MCNDAGHKGNAFPLSNPSRRSSPASPNISVESPLLLHPFDDNPEDHILWNRDVPVPYQNSPRGDASIKTFGLSKDERLIDARRSYYAQIEQTITVVESKTLPKKLQTLFISVLRKALDDKAPYTAMVRGNFSARIARL
jgi:hypothetical protein